MQSVSVASSNIFSAAGVTSEENFSALLNGESGVRLYHRPDIDDDPVWASLIDSDDFQKNTHFITNQENYTRYEKMIIASVDRALKNSEIDATSKDTIFIYSTTKGNISLLEEHDLSDSLIDKLSLYYSGNVVNRYFKNSNEPVIISNACISGVVALMVAQRLLKNGLYKNAVVVGADVITRFVYSGFKSFQALSSSRCAPFSENRDGINLGEAAATIILTTSSSTKKEISNIHVLEGAVTNDSNHISGPSRTGDELSKAIVESIQKSGISPNEIGFISAHGTATMYNDEMEAKAFASSGLKNVPLNSLKGYFGHTLGAAGVVESIISILSLNQNIIIPTAGFTTSGVSGDVTICSELTPINSNYCLKTASGFGGCNAALLFSKS